MVDVEIKRRERGDAEGRREKEIARFVRERQRALDRERPDRRVRRPEQCLTVVICALLTVSLRKRTEPSRVNRYQVRSSKGAPS